MHATRRARIVAGVVAVTVVLLGLIAPPSHAAPFTRTVSGHVYLGDSGRSAAAGEVVVTAYLSNGAGGFSAATDASGNYTLRITTAEAHISAVIDFLYSGPDGFSSATYPNFPFSRVSNRFIDISSADRPNTDMTLPGAVTVSGQVLIAPSWSPAPTGTVAVSWRREDPLTHEYGPESVPVLVGANGRYSFTLPGGYYHFRFSPLDTNAYAEIPFDVHGMTPAVPVFATPVELHTRTLYPPRSLSGRVTLGYTGDVYAGAGEVRVTANFQRTWSDPWTRSESMSVLTDAAGRFTLGGMETSGWYSLSYEWVGAPARAHAPILYDGLFAGVNGQRSGIDVRLARLGSISGVAFLGDRSHPAGAGQVRVTATSFGESPRSVVTDAAGRYTISGLREGGWKLAFEPVGDGRYSDQTPPEYQLYARDISDADATLPLQSALGGRVRGTDGRAVPGVTVTLRQFGSGGVTFEPLIASTDANGDYLFEGLEPERFFAVEYDGEGYAPQTWPDSGAFYEPGYVTLGQNEARLDVHAVLYRGATLSGMVKSVGIPPSDFEDGDVGVEVLVNDETAGRWVPTGFVVPVDADGSYSIEDLPPDDYRFQATYLGRRGESAVTSGVIRLGEGGSKVHSPTIRPFLRDLTGDLATDIVVTSGAGALYTYPGNGTGGFLTSRVIGSGWNGMTAVVNSGDFSGDGFADVIARDGAGFLWLYRGNGSGGWLGSTRIGSGWQAFDLIFSPGDFDGDGFTDVVARDGAGYLWLYKGDGAGGWRGWSKIGAGWGGFTSVLAASDMNEDGNPDVVARDVGGGLWLYPGNGSGGWYSAQKFGTGWAPFTAVLGVGDFDGDWHSDLVARDPSGGLWLYSGTGAGTVYPGRPIGSGWHPLRFVI